MYDVHIYISMHVDIYTKKSYICKIIINPHLEEVWSSFMKAYKWQVLKKIL